VSIECPAGSIPDKLLVNINSLALEQSIKVSDLKLPEGAVVLGDPEAVVVQCMVPVEAPEEEAAGAAPGEPEVIGAKKEEEGEAEE
jgi:large subunit ribosomal protein L25